MRAERLGKYQLVSHLASGGMASVYLARVSGPGGFQRHVVLKTLRTRHLADDTLVPMFLDEARLVAALHHQHIAQVFDVGSDDGTYYLAMEYVHGETVRRVIDTAQEHERLLPLAFGLTVVSAAAAGLHHAHERRSTSGAPLGIVHRDVTPSNVIVSYDGSIKLIDFGIAKAAERATHTRTGFIKGKVGYMAPEQIRGYAVDRRSDVFALGVLAYELLTLKRAFTGASQFDALERTVHSDLVPPTGVIADFPQELEDVIMTALQSDPDDRYPDAEAMRRDLERVAAKLNLTLGEAATTSVLDKLFGYRPEPWLVAMERDPDVEVTPVVAVPLLPRPPLSGQHQFARGSGAQESVDEEIDDEVTNRVSTIEPEDTPASERKLPLAPPGATPTPPDVAWEPPPPVIIQPARARSTLQTTALPPPEPIGTRVRPRRGWIALALVGAACAGIGIGVAVLFARGESAPSPVPARTTAPPVVATRPIAPPPPPPTPAPPSPRPVPATSSPPVKVVETRLAEIVLRVTTEPTGATVVLDGVRLGTTPYEAKLPTRAKPAWLKVRRKGSVATKIQVSLERDVTWDVRLTPLRR